MHDVNLSILPPQKLALSYLSAEFRPLLTLFLAFDSRMSQIYDKMNDVMIAQIRLAWWRDTIGKDSKPKGEPLISLIENAQTQYIDINLSHALIEMVNGWEILMTADDQIDDQSMLKFAQNTGGAIFNITASQSIGEDLADQFTMLGTIWALSKLYDDPQFTEQSKRLSYNILKNLNLNICASNLRTATMIAYPALHTLSNRDKVAKNEGLYYGIAYILHAITGRWGFIL